MNLQGFFNDVGRTMRRNSPSILTGASIVGVITTSYLTARATYKAAKIIDEMDREAVLGISVDSKERAKEIVKATWPLYITPVISGSLTIGCIVGSSKASANRTAAAMAAFSISERAFSEYKEKMVEQLKASKEEKIRAAIAQDRANSSPVPQELKDVALKNRQRVIEGEKSKEIVILGKKQVRCMEAHTGRYFLSDREALMSAQNEINARILRDTVGHASLSDFYDMIDIRHTQSSDYLGWNYEKMLELQFHVIVSEDDEPCFAFDYKHLPFPL